MRELNQQSDPRILVGTGTQDDAAVYLETPELAHVSTTDFFNPIVDDPYVFGGIAAANALSDIYAMGATPRFALNLVGFPRKKLSLDILEKILAGGFSKVKEAGIPVIGGHSIELAEPTYGLVVHGVVHPKKIIRNAGALPGDHLILTKALGTGLLVAGAKKNLTSPAQLQQACESMLRLNKAASEVMQRIGVNAATDVTGFGLLGHLKEMAAASQVTVRIAVDQLEFLPGARALAEKGLRPGAVETNLEYVQDVAGFSQEISAAQRILLADAQTSGGLLIAVTAEKSEQLKSELLQAGCMALDFGRVTQKGATGIQVMPGISET